LLKFTELKKGNDTLFLITNDDSIHARGLKVLIDIVRKLGKVYVIAPQESQSGMSHAITVKTPLRIRKIIQEGDCSMVSCNGTPVDCVKLALNKLLDRKPDMIISGINHGSNSSASIVYSGTMAAALEGCINGIPSIGLSLLDYSPDADFSGIVTYVEKIISRALENGIPPGTCLNVNFPVNHAEKIKGIKVCRQTKGLWVEEFDQRVDPQNRTYFWLTGDFINLEPDAIDTDEWALHNNFISIVPVQPDLTSYAAIPHLKKWKFD